MQPLTNAQKQYLRRLAHDLKPVVQVGKNGLSENLYEALEHELDAHELIKVKFMDFRDQKRELTDELVERTGSALILLIGNIAIVYRQQPDLERRKIRLPALPERSVR
jgi:RNA-binding protein